MQYPVQIEQQNGGFHASVLTVPTLTQTAPTKAEALRLLYDALLDYVQRTEIVYFDIPAAETAPATNHWLATAGIFADDPTLLPMLDDIYAARDDE